MKKIKVIQIVEDLKVGGLEMVIATIAQAINHEKFDLEIWCVARGGAIADELIKEGYTVKILNILTYHNPLSILKLVFLLRKAKTDIVHTHGYFGSVIGRIAAKFAGVKVIINHVHSTYFGYKKKHLVLEKFLSFVTDKIICCSKAVESFVLDYEKIKSEKIMLIYNGIVEHKIESSLEDTLSFKKQLNIEPADMLVGTVASLSLHKGHTYLFQAAVKIVSLFPNIKFLIVGDGPCKKELISQANALQIVDSFVFTGIRKDVANLINCMDIFVLPSSEREGLGIALIEAMAMAKPIIASNIGGIPEVVIDGKNGILVQPKDADGLSKAIIDLLNNKEKASKMGQAGYELFQEKFTAEVMINKLEELYVDLWERGESDTFSSNT